MAQNPTSLILIVEDVAEMQSLLQEMFKGLSDFPSPLLAKNTLEARVEILRRRPDLVLLDEVLPCESSLELLDEILAQKIPVFLITGFENTPEHPQRKELPPGVLGRLFKPTWKTLVRDRERFREALMSYFLAVSKKN